MIRQASLLLSYTAIIIVDVPNKVDVVVTDLNGERVLWVQEAKAVDLKE